VRLYKKKEIYFLSGAGSNSTGSRYDIDAYVNLNPKFDKSVKELLEHIKFPINKVIDKSITDFEKLKTKEWKKKIK